MSCTSRTYIRTLDLDSSRFACNGSGQVTVQDSGDFVLNDIVVVGNVATISGTHTTSDGTANAFSKTLTIPADVVTSISGNAAAGTITYVDELGASTVLDVCSIIATCDGGDFTFNAVTNQLSHTTSSGTVATVSLPVTSLSINPTTGVISFVDELGVTTDITPKDVGDLSYNALTGELTHTNSLGAQQTVSISLADGFVDSVTYSDVTQALTISWNTDAGLSDTVIDLSGLVDIYALAVTDTVSVDQTLTGTGTAGDPWTISADVIISPDADNILTSEANGLKVDYCAAFTALETAFPTLDCGGLPVIP